MRAATAENVASAFKKVGLYPCNSNIFGTHEFLVTEKDQSKLLLKPPKNLKQAPPMIKLILLQLLTFLLFLNFVRNIKIPVPVEVHPK
jgi:hypothetical protein